MPSPVPARVEVNEALTRKVADLARLELNDSEVRTFTHQLQDILAYVEQLASVDVHGVEPLTQAHPMESAGREDRVEASPVDAEGHSRMLEPAPEVLDHGFKVPQVV